MDNLTHIELDFTALRAARGDQTQEEIGAAVGVSGNQISRYELGHDTPSGNVLIRLMLRLNLSPTDLVAQNFLQNNSSSA